MQTAKNIDAWKHLLYPRCFHQMSENDIGWMGQNENETISLGTFFLTHLLRGQSECTMLRSVSTCCWWWPWPALRYGRGKSE